MTPQHTEPPRRRHWIVQAALCALSGYGCLALWPLGQEGDDLACAGACVLFLVASKSAFRALSAWDHGWEMRRLRRMSSADSGVHGTAEWASRDDVRKAGMFKPGGIFLGQAFGKNITYQGPGHLMCVAPTGAGKGVNLIVTNCLTYRGSMIITDVKGENAAMTMRHRSTFSDVVVLNPWRAKMTEELGIDLGDTSYNPLGSLKKGINLKDDAALLASLLVPGKAEMSESEAFFARNGRALLTAAMVYLREQKGDDESITLPEIRKALMGDIDALEAFLAHMAASESGNGAAAEVAQRIIAMKVNSDRQFEAVFSTAVDALEIYDGGPLGQHVSGNEFSFAQCKTGERPVTVYIVCPSERLSTHAAWLNLVVSAALEEVGRCRDASKRVFFEIEEAANLGYMPGLLKAMALYRGQGGVQVRTIWQSVPGQARRIYKDGWREMVALSECCIFFSVWDPETLELVSKWVGNRTSQDLTFSSHAEARFGGGQDVSISAVDRARPLLFASEMRTMPQGHVLILRSNMPVLMCKLVSYLERRSLRAKADPNPYHQRRLDDAA